VKEKKLGDLCDFISGLWTGKKPPYIKVGVLRNTNFNKDGSLSFDDIAMLDVEIKQFKNRKLEHGDIILEKSGGGPKQPVGRVCLFDKKEGDFSLSNFTSAIRIKNRDEVHYRYLHYYLYFMYVSGETLKIQTNSTGIRNLQLALYKEFSVPLPSLATQQKIVDKLDAIFAEIDRATVATETNINNAEALFQRYLADVFESGGDGWEKVQLPSLCTLFNGRAYNKDELLSAGKYTVLRVGNFFTSDRWYYSDLELDENKYCENGDLLYAWSASFGPKIWTGDKVIYHYHIWKVVPKNDVVDKHFLYYLLMWDVDKIKKDFGTGTTMVHVSKKSMESRVLPFVDLVTQKSIVRNINEVFDKSKTLKKSYEIKKKQLEIYKQSILKQAFNGELVKE